MYCIVAYYQSIKDENKDMIKRLSSYGVWCTLCCVSVASAGEMGEAAGSAIPASGWFIGLGGSYNSVKLDQYLDPLIGTSNVYNEDGDLVSYGSAGGPANPFHQTQTTFSPLVQAGYFKQMSHRSWWWGAKFQYQYLGLTASDNGIIAPQAGTFTNTDDAPADTTFTGRATIASAQTTVNHELAFIPFLANALSEKSYVYFGVGPSLFGTRTNLYNVTGFAYVNGVHLDVTGEPTNFSSSRWMWGGVAQMGITYFLKPRWSLDVNYTYAMTGKNNTSYNGVFTNQIPDYTITGTLYGVAKQRITSQALAVTINAVC